ncbi:MAG TPA: hypothetical protein VEU97_11640 [Ktedonobacteraceae bacterium]|nr:hypothetical protein [Ktedonobacteraceae bacterium]
MQPTSPPVRVAVVGACTLYSHTPISSEAAWIDGASTFQALFRVLLQIAAPGIAVVGVWSFLVVWTNFFVPLIILQSKS